MSAIGDGVCILDRTFKILYENQVHKNIMGDNEGKFCYRAYQKREGICTGCPIALTFKDGKIHTVQRELKTNSESLYFEITASPLKDTKKNIIAGIEVVRDITKRKKTEKKLKENEERLKSIFRASPAGIGVVSSPDRILLKVNERLCKMLGYANEELVGNSARKLYPTNEDFEYVGKRKYELIQEHGVGTVETRWKCKDGRIIDVLLSSSPIDIANPSVGVTFTAMDITEKKISERLLTESQEELQKKVETLEEFYSIAVGRELRMKQLKEEMERLKGELSKYKEGQDKKWFTS
jgi:PAS domain S-box-containing protein